MIDSHIISTLGWTLIHFLWQGTAIVAVYWLISRSSQSLHAKYWTGMGAVLLSLFVPINHFVSHMDGYSSQGLVLHTSTASFGMAAIQPSTGDLLMALVNQMIPYLVATWALVVIVMTLGLIRSWFELNAIEHDCEPALSSELKQFIKNMAIKLDLASIPLLKVSKDVLVPAAYGIYKPTVLLPLSLMSQLPKEQIHAIITHELCHLKRNDFLHNIVQITADVLLFFHPAIRWMNNDIRQVREQCCDQLVLSQKTNAITYAKALTNIASLSHDMAFNPKLQIGISDGQLLKRVKYLLQNKSSQSSIMVFVPLALMMLTCIYVFKTPAIDGQTSFESAAETENKNKQSKRFVNHQFFPKAVPVTTQEPDFLVTEATQFDTQLTLPEKAASQVQAPQSEIQQWQPEVDTQTPTISQDMASVPQPEMTIQPMDGIALDEIITLPVASNNQPIKTTTSTPQLLEYIAPEFPRQLWASQVEQTVIANFKISPNGRVDDIHIRSKGKQFALFEFSVKKALKQWRFNKASLTHANTQQTYQRIFEFKISDEVTKNCQRVTTGSRMRKAVSCNR